MSMHPAPADEASPVPQQRTAWRAAGIGITSIGFPVGVGLLHPLFGEIIGAAELALMFVVICTALFGSPTVSDRAFRLLLREENRPRRAQAAGRRFPGTAAQDCYPKTGGLPGARCRRGGGSSTPA